MIYEGRIIKGIGGFYYVKSAGELIECKAAGRFRKERRLPTVGDVVTVKYEPEKNKESYGLITEISERKNRISRQNGQRVAGPLQCGDRERSCCGNAGAERRRLSCAISDTNQLERSAQTCGC